MLLQLTVHAKIIYLLMVVISGALCTVQDYVITSKCAHSKPIHISPEGIVSIKDFPMIQNITIVGTGKFWGPEKLKITLYAKETKMYLCFDKYWKLVGMKTLEDTCYFNETMAHGYLEFRSTVDLSRRVGFTHRGKAIGPKKKVKNDCYLFSKVKSDQYFKNQDAFKRHTPPLSLSSPQTVPSGRSVSRNSSSLPLSSSKSSILVENGESSFMRNGQSTRGRNRTKADKKSNISGAGAARNRQPNRHNSNLSNNSTSNSRRGYSNLSSTNNNHRNHHNHNNNVQQQPITELSNVYQDTQSAQHHPVRHHHDNFNSTARRQQNQRERWLRNNQQQNQQQSTKYVQRATSEIPATVSIASPTLPILTSIPSLLLPLSSSTATESSLEDGNASESARTSATRKRKNSFKNRQQQSLNTKGLKNKRTLKRQQKSIGTSSSPSTTEYAEKASPSSSLPPPLFSLTTEDDDMSSQSLAKMLLRSTIEPYIAVTSDDPSSSEPTPMALLQEIHSSSTVLIEPSPSTHFEQIAFSTIIPCSTTALDVSSSSLEPSLDESSFNILYPGSQSADDITMTADFNSSVREEGNYSSTTDNTENVKNDLSTEIINNQNSASNDSRVPMHTVIYRNHYTKYSNDSASLTSVLPNYLDNSMTEYQNSNSSSNFTNNENNSNYTKYYKTENMDSDKLLVAISNTGSNSVTSTNTASTPTTTNHRNSNNNSSYLNNNTRNKSRKINSNINIDKLFPTEKTISNKNNKYDNVTNIIQPSSYYSTSSTKSKKIVTNSLGSEEKLYYNKKSINSTTASTTDPLQVLTTVSAKKAILTKTTSNHNLKSINVNNYVDDDTVEGTYDTMGDDDFGSEEIAGSNEELKTFGYLPTTTSQLPEIIKIGVNKIKGSRSRFRKSRNIGF